MSLLPLPCTLQHQVVQEPLSLNEPLGDDFSKEEAILNKEALTRPLPPLFPVANGNHSLSVKELWAWYNKGRVDPAGSPECSFSSRPPSRQPTVDMIDLTERLPFDNPDGGAWKQGFEITYSTKDFATEPLQVFVVPHSHTDPGWLFTFEEYYNRQTRNIFDNIFKGLRGASSRKFIYAEMSFLSLWWKSQNDWTKEEFRKCVLIDMYSGLLVTGRFLVLSVSELSHRHISLLRQRSS